MKARYLIIFVFVMLCLTYASVPLYNIFCKVTGFGGTTQEAISCPEKLGKREIKIRFNADTDKLFSSWKFTNDNVMDFSVITGQCALTWYYSYNPTSETLKGMAVYNVTPLKAGKYFHKVDCFCFREQVLYPGQRVSMPVLFYIDPDIENDPEMNDVHSMTLSYKFYPFQETFYNNLMNKYGYKKKN